jgi:hypothetical protein
MSKSVRITDNLARTPSSRSEQIRAIVKKRGISTLIHFTRIDNFDSILHWGLLSRRELDKWPETRRPDYNDVQRHDKQLDAVCISISFPNYLMFHKYSKRDKQNWIMLLLNPSLLWELDCAFCRRNAACKSVTQIPIEERKSVRAFQSMFDDLEGTKRDLLQIPDHYTTDPQAEVLVFEPIKPQYIYEVHFCDDNVLRNWQESKRKFKPKYNPEVRLDKTFFKPRRDYEFWRPSAQPFEIEARYTAILNEMDINW